MKRTYLDTYGDGGYTYADYMAWCEDCEVTPGEENGESYWRWVQEELEFDIEDFEANIKPYGPCVVEGTLHLWNGRAVVGPERFGSLLEAVRACWDGCEAARVYLEDGVVTVEAMHHDGTNVLDIRPEDGLYPEYLY